jgi:hypothetical protein
MICDGPATESADNGSKEEESVYSSKDAVGIG